MIAEKLCDIFQLTSFGLFYCFKSENIFDCFINFSRQYYGCFVQFDCCGVNSYSVVTDFNGTKWHTGGTRGADKIPGYCCKEAMKDTAASLSGKSCTTAPTAANSWVEKVLFDTVLQQSL